LFGGFLQPHSCIPYVHMGFIMHLYSSSLFSMDSLDLQPKSQDFLEYPSCVNLKFIVTNSVRDDSGVDALYVAFFHITVDRDHTS
jgi:hypothetical protein